MKPELAREILYEYLQHKYSLPVHDEVIKYIRPKTIDELDLSWAYDEDEGMIKEHYTFRNLIKIAYNLKENV